MSSAFDTDTVTKRSTRGQNQWLCSICKGKRCKVQGYFFCWSNLWSTCLVCLRSIRRPMQFLRPLGPLGWWEIPDTWGDRTPCRKVPLSWAEIVKAQFLLVSVGRSATFEVSWHYQAKFSFRIPQFCGTVIPHAHVLPGMSQTPQVHKRNPHHMSSCRKSEGSFDHFAGRKACIHFSNEILIEVWTDWIRFIRKLQVVVHGESNCAVDKERLYAPTTNIREKFALFFVFSR